ncbi:MAG: InlB B-repeat-containing protein, partial [Clostridia bacterium]|nr:InlB B-repeat-containing protein [Clostridia bacterium]
DPQGGKWSDDSTAVKEEGGLYKEALNKVPEEPTYEHHNFEGWSTEVADGTTSQVVNGVTYVGGKQSEILTDDEVKALTFEQDNDIKTLYAVWSVEQYTVKFVNYDNSVLQEGKWDYGSTPSYSGETPQKPATADKTFSYSGWSPDIAEVTADAVYTAQYTDETKTFTITFVDDDGTTVLQTVTNVPYGTTPAYTGTPLSKTNTAEFTYSWDPADGWTESIVAATADKTYTAKYTATKNKYDVKFEDVDGNIIGEVQNIEYGSTPTVPEVVPTKPSSDGKDYVFAGWSPDPTQGITGETVYTPTFTEKGQVFTITFKNEDGTVLQTLTNVAYGTTPAYTGDTPTKAPTADYTYTFDKWTPEIVAATGNATYTATFTETYIPKQVKDTFSYIDSKDNSVIGEPIVKSGTEGETYEVPEVNIPEGYEKSRNVNYLDGIPTWGSDGVFGSEDRNFSIPLDRKSYNITFVDENGEEISTEPVEYKGEIPEAPEVPEERTNEEGKVEIFKGWVASDGESQPGGKMPAHEVTFTPKYEEKKYDYTVTYYKDEDHKEVYSTSSIKAGDPITGPDNGDPQKFGYKFTGWQGTDGLKVGDTMPEKDIELTAQWELDKGLIAAAVGGAAIAGAAGTIAAANTALITGGAIVGGAALIGGGVYLANNTHKVVYMVDGEVYRTFFVIDGTKVIVPSDPSKSGYTFAGWDNEIPGRMPNHDLTFNAKFVAGENADVPATGSATAGFSALAIISAATAAAYVISTRKKEEN